jgi:hypothetical protein
MRIQIAHLYHTRLIRSKQTHTKEFKFIATQENLGLILVHNAEIKKSSDVAVESADSRGQERFQ